MCAYSTGNKAPIKPIAKQDDPLDRSRGEDARGRRIPAGLQASSEADNPGLTPLDSSGFGLASSNASGSDLDDLAVIRAGWPEDAGEGCVTLDPAAVLRANRRSFVLRVRGQSMIGAGICDGDLVIGDFTPEARPGAIVVALIDGESTLKRFVMHHGKPFLASENPNYPDLIPLSELVIQGVVHTVVRRIR